MDMNNANSLHENRYDFLEPREVLVCRRLSTCNAYREDGKLNKVFELRGCCGVFARRLTLVEVRVHKSGKVLCMKYVP